MCTLCLSASATSRCTSAFLCSSIPHLHCDSLDYCCCYCYYFKNRNSMLLNYPIDRSLDPFRKSCCYRCLRSQTYLILLEFDQSRFLLNNHQNSHYSLVQASWSIQQILPHRNLHRRRHRCLLPPNSLSILLKNHSNSLRVRNPHPD